MYRLLIFPKIVLLMTFLVVVTTQAIQFLPVTTTQTDVQQTDAKQTASTTVMMASTKPVLSKPLSQPMASTKSLTTTASSVSSMPARPLSSSPLTKTEMTTTWKSLGHPSYPSLLRIPPTCSQQACPLVVVSHPRNQSAYRLRDSKSFKIIADVLLQHRFAILLSGDGGKNTWGSPQALKNVAKDHDMATKLFHWNGNTHALGFSMGGLLSLRSALPDSPYQVQSVALIDAWVDLISAWKSSTKRREEIQQAYEISAPPTHLNPLNQMLQSPYMPLFVASSLEDNIVPAMWNGERLYSHGVIGISQFINLSGPHMGGNRFTEKLSRQLVFFFQRSEWWYASGQQRYSQ